MVTTTGSTTGIKKQIEQLNVFLINRSEEFNSDIEGFSKFINNAITRELHSMTLKSENEGMSLNEFEALMHNIEMMKDIIGIIENKQTVDTEGLFYSK